MSIFDETGQSESITELWRAINLFSNRHHAIRMFCTRLNQDPPPKSILYFYGDGGNGKTLLLNYLQRNCCKRLSERDWQGIRGLSDKEVAEHCRDMTLAAPVPSALLDFGMKPTGEENPQNAFYALLMIWRSLSHHGIHLPLYSYACVMYLHKTRQPITPERLKALFPSEELGLITTLVDALSHTAWGSIGSAVLNLFQKHLKEKAALYLQKRKIGAAQADAIAAMDEIQLREQLPRLFAQDLNAAMEMEGAPKRLALFFDTHEAFWGNLRDLSDHLYFERDEWLRLLLGSIKLDLGIVVVVAGRERPRWSEATRYRIPADYIVAHEISYLTEADASISLEKADITDPEMRRSLINFACVGPDQVHPYYVGLSADIVLAAQHRGTPLIPADFANVPAAAEKGAALIDRLLRYVDTDIENAVTALSACRAFDYDVFKRLGAELDFVANAAAFEVLTRFSFVWEAKQRRTSYYRIHDLLRKLFRDRNEPLVGRADAVLEAYYLERANSGEEIAVVEAIYHINRQDWERGVDRWLEEFAQALTLSHYDLCEALQSIRGELNVQSDMAKGRLAAQAGDYFATMSRYREAEQEFRQSIQAFDTALQRAPDYIGAYNNKGLTLQRLGDLQAQLSQHPDALRSYEQSIQAYDAALQRAPDYIGAYNNKGNTLQRLGNLQAQLSQHADALRSYEQSIQAYDAALQRAPDYINAYNNKGNTLQSLGDLQAQLGMDSEALHSLENALALFSRSLELAPNNQWTRERRDALHTFFQSLSQQNGPDAPSDVAS